MRPYLVFLIVFALTRAVFYAAGLRFSTEHAAAIMHFVDLELLQHRLLETLYYLHGQPPLMPLLMGLLLKACGDSWPVVMSMLFHAAGLGIGWNLISLFRSLGWPASAAVPVAAGFSILPACIVYEHYLFFTLPVVFILLLAARLLLSALRKGTGPAWLWFFLVAAILVNFRNLFHLAWLLVLLPLGLLSTKKAQRQVVLLAFLPALAFGGTWYVKNAVVFGRFEASSWIGFGLARKMYHQARMEDRREWIESGLLDPIAGVEVYGSVADYATVLGHPQPTGIPVLDHEVKSSGWTNYHHAIYLDASRRMRDESLRLIWKHPEWYWRNVLATVRLLFHPSTQWAPVRTPFQQARWWCDPIDGVLFLPFGTDGICAWSLLAVVVLWASVPKTLRLLRLRERCRPEDVLYVFMAGTILYVYAAAVLLDSNESMRHRFLADGLLWACACLLVPSRLSCRPHALPDHP